LAINENDDLAFEYIAASRFCYERLSVPAPFHISYLHIVIEEVAQEPEQRLFSAAAVAAQIEYERFMLPNFIHKVVNFVSVHVELRHLPDHQVVASLYV